MTGWGGVHLMYLLQPAVILLYPVVFVVVVVAISCDVFISCVKIKFYTVLCYMSCDISPNVWRCCVGQQKNVIRLFCYV